MGNGKMKVLSFPKEKRKKKDPTPLSDQAKRLAKLDPESYQDISDVEYEIEELREKYCSSFMSKDKSYELPPYSVEFRKFRDERGKFAFLIVFFDSFTDYGHEIHIELKNGVITVYDYSMYTEQSVKRDKEYQSLIQALEEVFLDCHCSYLDYEKYRDIDGDEDGSEYD